MSKRKRGRRGLRVALASAIAALGVSAVGVSSASAATVTLDHGFLKIALPDAFEIIDDTTGPVVLSNFEDAGGAYTVTTADVDFPQFSGTLFGQPLTVDVTPLANLTGTYDPATGTLNGNVSNWSSTIDFAGDPCVISPIPLAFTTNTNAVFEGNAFDAASSPPVNGAISDDWAALPPGVGAGCGLINSATNAPGGLWLSNGVLQPTFVPPPPEPPATTPTTPAPTTKKKKKCKKKKKGKSASAAAKK